ncbi:hypothetical protein GGP41_007011 [Bipolaris sorokiniana]|uniref:Uncharacterized protein n=1 Tax=Cochliobolus sativus TaxID=45130 RepID=A0A8H5ZTX6_COCSA|nr:hypothetical protein GGP41_007011 [Bipolaris sorokiniana]
MAKKTRPNRPTTSRSVNKTTPTDTRVTVDAMSASSSQSSCEDTSFSDDMTSLHSRERLTPTSPSVFDVESDSEGDKKHFDLEDELFEDEEQDTLLANYSIQKTESASATEKSPASRGYISVPLQMPVAAALGRELTNLRAAEAAQHQSQKYHEAEPIGGDVKASIISRLKKSSNLEGTSKPVKKSPSATAKSSNAKDALIADSATVHAQSLSDKPNKTLRTTSATIPLTVWFDNLVDFTYEEASNFIHMCGGSPSAACHLYHSVDDPNQLKQAVNNWLSSHQNGHDNGAAKYRKEANKTSVKQEYCKSEVSDDTAHSASAHSEKDHRGAADDACAGAVWGTKTVIQHVHDCLNTWCNGRCVEELAQEADSTTAYPDSAQLEKDHHGDADGPFADDAWHTNAIQHADTCWDFGCYGECVERLAYKTDSTAPDEGLRGSTDGEAIPACAPRSNSPKPARRDINPEDSDPKTTSVPDEQDIPDDIPDDSTPEVPEPTNYIVTYWATIEHNDQTVHIPIDSSNVSGSEKSIIEGSAGMNKVWKWVQEKGLTDKVSLQDAFDLAKDMQVGSPSVVEESCEEESEGYAGSAKPESEADDDSEYVSSSFGSSSSSSESHRGESPESRAWATSGTILGWAA